MVKVITGTKKGKRLETLSGDSTRPTSERIKGAMFSSIQFDIDGRRVLDLFAGCGQLGIEAMSRGAVSVTFVDSERDAMDIIKKNTVATGFFDKCRYVVSDWRNYIRKASGRDVYDLVFIDPPYALGCCTDAARRLADGGMLSRGAIVVLESGGGDVDVSGEEILSDFEVIKSTDYGKKTSLNILLYLGE